MSKENTLIKMTCILLCIVLGALISVYAFKYLLSAVLPFIIAWLFATALKKPSKFLAEHTRLRRKSANIICGVVAILVIGYIIYLFVSMLFHQISDIYVRLSTDKSAIDNIVGTIQKIRDSAQTTIEKIPYLGEKMIVKYTRAGFEDNIASKLSEILLSFVPIIGNLIGKIAKIVPYSIVFLLVTIIASIYFSADLEKINRSVVKIFPAKKRKMLFTVKTELIDVMVGYLRAYSILFALTFSELFVGLNIIGVKYSFLISALTAFVDILPIFGIGAVLLPWAFVLFIFDNFKKAIGLVVLYIVITIIRQSIESKIIGEFLGLHPLLALFSMYVGIRICGVWGLFLFPIIFIVAKNIFSKRKALNNE